MKKKYPGVSAEHIRCTPEDIVHLSDMNEDENELPRGKPRGIKCAQLVK